MTRHHCNTFCETFGLCKRLQNREGSPLRGDFQNREPSLRYSRLCNVSHDLRRWHLIETRLSPDGKHRNGLKEGNLPSMAALLHNVRAMWTRFPARYLLWAAVCEARSGLHAWKIFHLTRSSDSSNNHSFSRSLSAFSRSFREVAISRAQHKSA